MHKNMRLHVCEKSHQKFSALKYNFFFLKKVIRKCVRPIIISVPPKLGARSPPMDFRETPICHSEYVSEQVKLRSLGLARIIKTWMITKFTIH